MTDHQISSWPIDPDATTGDRARPHMSARNPFAGSGPLVTTSVQQDALEMIGGWIRAVSADPTCADRLAVLTGDTGMGKSRLLRDLAASVTAPAAAPLIDPGKGGITDAQLLRAMVDALGGTATGRTGMELRRDIRAALADLPEGTVPGLLIDDADFTGARLELIRNVLRDGAGFGLWIVLTGQPDLADRVSRRRSLKAILGPVAHIGPLDEPALRGIVSGRVEAIEDVARSRPVIADDALETLVSGAAGNPGRLLRMAEIALGIGVRQGAGTISRPAVLAAIHEVDDAAGAVPETRRSDDGIIQVEMPLLAGGASGTRSTTVQKSLWEREAES